MSPGHADNGRDYVYHCLNLDAPRSKYEQDAPLAQEMLDKIIKSRRYAVSVETAERLTAERIKLEKDLLLRPDDNLEEED